MASPQRIASATVVLFVIVTAALVAQRGTPAAPASSPADATARIVASAQMLLTTLDTAGKAKVQFPAGSPQKTRWSNLPSGIFQRTGLRLGDLTAGQRAAVMALLTTALSKDGYQKVVEIMHGDEVLRTQGGGRGGG